MNNIRQFERLKRIHNLIQNERTGTPKELAILLKISERQVFLLLEYLKDMDAPLYYNRKARTYYYKGFFDLRVIISIQVILEDEMLNIYAGYKRSEIESYHHSRYTARFLQSAELSSKYQIRSEYCGLDVAF